MLVTWSSPVIPKLNNATRIDENPLGRLISESEGSWLGSLLNVGAAIAPFPTGFSSGKIGRKPTLIIITIPYIVSAFILAFAKNIYLYYFARILGGAALGATFTIVPVYVSEISENDIRGILGAMMNIFVTVGILVSFAIGPFTSVTWYCISCSILPLICLGTLYCIPESPYFFMGKNKVDEAARILETTRKNTQNEAIQKEIEDIKYFVEIGSQGKFSDLFTLKAARKGLTISCMLMVFQQLSGINAITFYVESLFAESGSHVTPEVSSIIFGAAQAAATFITPFFIDSYGRKTLLFISAIGMVLSETSLGVYFYLKENSENVSDLNWMPITCLTVYIATHNLAFAPVPWLIMSEVFPDKVRLIAADVVTCFSWCLSFLMTFLMAPLQNAITIAGTFFFFSAWVVVAIFFVIFYVPETKGRSFQEIQDILNK